VHTCAFKLTRDLALARSCTCATRGVNVLHAHGITRGGTLGTTRGGGTLGATLVLHAAIHAIHARPCDGFHARRRARAGS